MKQTISWIYKEPENNVITTNIRLLDNDEQLLPLPKCWVAKNYCRYIAECRENGTKLMIFRNNFILKNIFTDIRVMNSALPFVITIAIALVMGLLGFCFSYSWTVKLFPAKPGGSCFLRGFIDFWIFLGIIFLLGLYLMAYIFISLPDWKNICSKFKTFSYFYWNKTKISCHVVY